MKKLLLTLCACALIGAAQAQDLKKATLYLPGLDVEAGTEIIGTIYGVSSNGEYAVGYDDLFESCAFLWTRSTGQFEVIELASLLYDVSNDGIIVGDYWIEMPGGSGEVATKPGYYKDGEWHALPTRRQDEFLVAGGNDLNGYAVAISGDGQFIAGVIPDAEIYKLSPVLWKWDETIQDYVIENSFDFLFEEIDRMECPVGWVTKDMSDDGSIITGFYEWGSGARSSAALINGEVKRLTCLQDPLELPIGEEDIYMDAEGQAKVSANGQYFAGYYAASANGMGMSGWVWTPEQESVTFTGEGTVLVCTDNNGTAYGSETVMGPAMKYVDGTCVRLSDEYEWESPYTFSTIFATSDDGGVLGGISMANLPYYGIVQVPSILVVDGTEGVASVQTKGNSVVMYNGVAFINGEYNKAQVYNVQGMVVAEATEGNIDLNGVPAGVYIVNVDGQSFKVVK